MKARIPEVVLVIYFLLQLLRHLLVGDAHLFQRL
jgi:hypothetical protein